MRMKSVDSLEAYITTDGRIALEQKSIELGKYVYIYLTIEQFNSLERWIFNNKDKIESKWNGGMEDDLQS